MSGPSLPIHWRWLATAAVALGLVAGTALIWRQPSPPPLQVVAPTPAPGALKVYVSGAVTRPGVYSFGEGDRVDDVLQAAGGPTAEADLDRVNLSMRLRDQLHVIVPARPVSATTQVGEVGGNSAPSSDDLINLNTATAEQLDALPQVGPATIKKIIDHREREGPFQRIEELLELKLVNTSTFDLIKGRITAP